MGWTLRGQTSARNSRQGEPLGEKRWATQEVLRIAIVTWIERTYHRTHRQARLGHLTPIEYEATMTTQVALVA